MVRHQRGGHGAQTERHLGRRGGSEDHWGASGCEGRGVGRGDRQAVGTRRPFTGLQRDVLRARRSSQLAAEGGATQGGATSALPPLPPKGDVYDELVEEEWRRRIGVVDGVVGNVPPEVEQLANTAIDGDTWVTGVWDGTQIVVVSESYAAMAAQEVGQYLKEHLKGAWAVRDNAGRKAYVWRLPKRGAFGTGKPLLGRHL